LARRDFGGIVFIGKELPGIARNLFQKYDNIISEQDFWQFLAIPFR
jgi:hypothetical protein